ncbi:MAG: DUF3306 domain-containing protein [Caldimonas sp.]
MTEDAEGFIARWSRRKAGLPNDAAETVEAAEPAPHAPEPRSVPLATTEPPATAPAIPEPVVLPTMEDVATLTRNSDYSRFVLPGVDPAVKNAAMKKLFRDPHFNVMDGLDIYVGDYSQPDPIPPAMLRMMNQAASLGLFDGEDDGVAGAVSAKASPDGAAADPVAQSPPPAPLPASTSAPDTRSDDDPDLRLQPDDAARRPGPGPGPRA